MERARDVTVYLCKDDQAPPRPQRLAKCASLYSRALGLVAGDFTVAVAKGGKPYFPHCPQVHFSISHSGEYWAVAFSSLPVGLDIQRHEQRDYLSLAKRWYHPQEYAAVEQYGKQCFFDIWCAKESRIKCGGTGFPALFPTFSVVEKGAIAAVVEDWQIKPLNIDADYSACLCGQQLGRVNVCLVF